MCHVITLSYLRHLCHIKAALARSLELYQRTANGALFFAFIYGFGVPALLIIMGIFLKKFGGMKLEYSTLAFLVGGYHPEMRYWETMNMLRCVARETVLLCWWWCMLVGVRVPWWAAAGVWTGLPTVVRRPPPPFEAAGRGW